MNNHLNRNSLYTILALLALLPALALADVSKEQQWEFAVDENTELGISNVNGDITISATDGDQLVVTAKLKADSEKAMNKIQIEVKEANGTISIKTIHEESSSWFNWGRSNSGEVEFSVQMPAFVMLKNIATVNGDIEITGVKTSARVSTINGDLGLTGLSGDTDLSTVNGDIMVKFQSFDAAQNASIQTTNGSVVVYLPANASTKVVAETVNGNIRADDFGLEAIEGSFVGSNMEGDIGSGSATLSMQTVNGSIKVKSSDT